MMGKWNLMEGCNVTWWSRNSLVQFPISQSVLKIKDKYGLSNGIVINEKTNSFYSDDFYDLKIMQFDYDGQTGPLTNETGIKLLQTSYNGLFNVAMF